jgi:hypothetical protein
MRRRLLYWYGRLKFLEESLDSIASEKEMTKKEAELERIEDVVSHIRFPLSLTDQLYDFRGHIDFVRRRLASRTVPAERFTPERQAVKQTQA